MAYFPENIMLSRADDLLVINKVNNKPDKVLKGYDGAHSIKAFASYEISVDSAYRNNLIEEITGLSSHLKSCTTAEYTIKQLIRSNTGNEMHRFLKVSDANGDEYPIALFASAVLPSFMPTKRVKGNISAFAHRYEFFPTLHEAELHIKLDNEYYGPLSKVNNGFYTPVDDTGNYKSLAISTLLKIKKMRRDVIMNIQPHRRLSSLIAVCESKLGDLYISLPVEAVNDRSASASQYLWCDMILSLDVSASEGELNTATLTEYLASSLIFSEFSSLYYRLTDDVELFYDNALIKGRRRVIDKLKEIKSIDNCWIEDCTLDEPFEGVEEGTISIAYFINKELLYYIFIEADGEFISRIMFREV